MGRKRKKDKHLPERMYFRHGAFYFVPKTGPWVLLEDKETKRRDYPAALREYAKILGSDAPTTTVTLLIARYEAEELPSKAAKSQKNRRQQFKAVEKAFGPMDPDKIEPHHAWGFWKARGETEQARKEVRALSVLMTFARRIGARKGENPCFDLQLPGSGHHRDRYVTDEEYLFVRDLAQPMVGHAMDLALVGGMDESTILKLERKHWSAEGFRFWRSKTRHNATAQEQHIEWSEELDMVVKAILRERPELRRALICNRKGQPYSANGFQSQWQRLCRRVEKVAKERGIDFERFHFHDLRAKSASDAGSDQEAADRLGHGDVKLTRRVYRRLPRKARPLKVFD